jgi:polyhydroxyalkanoate synthesis regulator phasin
MARRRRSPVSRLLGDLSDDTKGFVDDLTARARAAEGHAREALRHATGEDGSEADADRREVEELSAALAELTKKVNRLADGQREPGGAPASTTEAGG